MSSPARQISAACVALARRTALVSLFLVMSAVAGVGHASAMPAPPVDEGTPTSDLPGTGDAVGVWAGLSPWILVGLAVLAAGGLAVAVWRHRHDRRPARLA